MQRLQRVASTRIKRRQLRRRRQAALDRWPTEPVLDYWSPPALTAGPRSAERGIRSGAVAAHPSEPLSLCSPRVRTPVHPPSMECRSGRGREDVIACSGPRPSVLLLARTLRDAGLRRVERASLFCPIWKRTEDVYGEEGVVGALLIARWRCY